MTDYSNPIDHTTYTRDKTTFEIEIFKDENNNFYMQWVCPICNNKGSSGSTNPDINIVLFATKANASSHYGANHLKMKD